MNLYPASYWIEKLKLEKHVEGGAFSEVYRSPLMLNQQALPASFTGPRNSCTHIFFLLEQEQFSAFHRIFSDELWHFYAGDPLFIYEIAADGNVITHHLGNDPEEGQSFFCMINAGSWFASCPAAESSYSLCGCTVSPGFDFADFELATPAKLVEKYPQHEALIRSLCR